MTGRRLELRELPDAVVAETGSLPASLEGAVRVGPFSVARPGAILRIVPGLARFLARDGYLIEYAMEHGGNREAIIPLIQGPLCAALIHQRGELPLHAASLVPPNKRTAVAIAGDKGAGKSTLSWALMARGWRLLNDDLTRLTDERGGITAWPGRNGVRLRDDACARFGLDTALLRRVAGEMTKYLAEAEAAKDTAPLGAVILLDRSPGGTGPRRLSGSEAAAAISRNSYRISYVGPLGIAASHLRMAARVAGACPIVRLSLEVGPELLAESVETLAEELLPIEPRL